MLVSCQQYLWGHWWEQTKCLASSLTHSESAWLYGFSYKITHYKYIALTSSFYHKSPSTPPMLPKTDRPRCIMNIMYEQPSFGITNYWGRTSQLLRTSRCYIVTFGETNAPALARWYFANKSLGASRRYDETWQEKRSITYRPGAEYIRICCFRIEENDLWRGHRVVIWKGDLTIEIRRAKG